MWISKETNGLGLESEKKTLVYLRLLTKTPSQPLIIQCAGKHRWCQSETNSINEQVKPLQGSSMLHHWDQQLSCEGIVAKKKKLHDNQQVDRGTKEEIKE